MNILLYYFIFYKQAWRPILRILKVYFYELFDVLIPTYICKIVDREAEISQSGIARSSVLKTTGSGALKSL